TASGRYGFTMSTWNRYFRSIYRDTKLSSNEIWAKRFDGNLQDVMMRALTADNAHRLRAAGLPETTGNLYLLHFAGPDGLKVLHAAPETPLERLLPPRDFAANPFLKGKTAGELIGWADRRMGGRGEARPPRGGEPAAEPAAEAAPAAEEEPWPELREEPRDFAPDEALHASEDMPVLRPELFGTPEEHARAQMAVWREAGLADPSGAVDAPAPGPSIEMRGRAAMDRSGPVDVMQAVADAGGLLDNEGHDLAKGRGIPAFVKGAGVIIRKAGDPRGRSVDAVGEHLWEQGYFGPPETTPRPREAEVLDLVDRAVREKVYKPEEAAAAAERKARRSAPSEADALDELRAVAREGGVDLDPATLHTALMHRAAGESPEGAVARAVQEAAFRELGPPAELARFDDPDGEGVQAQIDSLDHDLRMALEAGAAGEAYRLNDAGEPMTIEEMFEALDEDDRTNAVLRGCMAPTAMAAE
ncbi:MAG: hypothetical protein QOH04_1530, partial [Sphingomonadales bacterium]|nr:hypothetical protein [Sphingomonadales bacterium]